MSRFAASVFAVATAALAAQGPPPEGPRAVDPGWFVLTGARVVVDPATSLERANVVLRDGRIVGVDAAPPAGATPVDCSGLTIYPGLVDPFVATDVPALDAAIDDQHWNPMVQPQRSARDGGLVPAAERSALRRLGFTTVACVPTGGIVKGTSTVVQLDEPTSTSPATIVRDVAALVTSLQTRDGYPNSEMGAIAVLRQALFDGAWYRSCIATLTPGSALPAGAPRPSSAFAALAERADLPLWFDARDELQALRAVRVANEAGRSLVLVGSGMEFRRLAALAAAKVPIVVPLQFPEAPDVASASAAERVSLRQLQSWEQAPTNTKRLLDAGVDVAWTTARMRDKKDFRERVAEAIACGVSAQQALALLTTKPAALLGIADQAGTITRGKLANLVVVEGDLFDPKSRIRDVWVGGVRHTIQAAKDAGVDGSWSWTTGWPGKDPKIAPTLTVDGESVKGKAGGSDLKFADVVREPDRLSCRVAGESLDAERVFWLRVHQDGGALVGTCVASDGTSVAVRAERSTDEAKGKSDEKKGGDDARPAPPSIGPLPTPLGGYGFLAMPAKTEFVLVGATLWPCDGRGVLRDGAVHVRDGRIVFAGSRSDMGEPPGGVQVIDATGKHVTPGIIDCHSHTGISRGVNEGGEAVTAEVRVEDVIDPDDVNWYRELAGGVTAVNQLHGSANAIGGQSCTVKLRWGVPHPDDMRFAGAPTGIKFALGENPRQANDRGPNRRYPNTRMGVEALLRDRFAAADAYRTTRAAYEKLAPAERAKAMRPRRDLELEALAEVLDGIRRIHCHSYRQDEIFMLCGLARELGIKIGTFQHVLEGYKVADAIGANAVGASSFSDWWAYKFEVWDAIPDNGAIMHEAGVCVSFNSDSNEHARRLNTEAGKAVKYGGVAPWDALCFVTKNPAIQLGVFDRTGSLTAGKDADLVLWSDDPLSYAARCEATWVDGRLLFSLGTDRSMREAIAAERQRLIGKAAASGKKRTARDGDTKDAYWAAEDLTTDYCCRDCEGAR